MRIMLIVLTMILNSSTAYHYDDEDGHRGPWKEWVESSCVSPPWVVFDSEELSPNRPCNPTTNLGFTAWMCMDGSDRGHPYSFYTTHWYCPTIGDAIRLHSVFLPLVR